MLHPQFFTCFFVQFLLDSLLSLCFLPPLKVCFWGFCCWWCWLGFLEGLPLLLQLLETLVELFCFFCSCFEAFHGGDPNRFMIRVLFFSLLLFIIFSLLFFIFLWLISPLSLIMVLDSCRDNSNQRVHSCFERGEIIAGN